ncbi:MAG TPA: hypothetical protein VH418_13230 [Solirubrobacteraceae bacterium]
MNRTPFLAAGVLTGLALVAAVVALLAGGRTAPAVAATPTWKAPGGAWTIAAPKGWHAVALKGGGAVLQRADRRGTVVVRPAGAIKAGYPALVKQLTASLKRRFTDVQTADVRTAPLGSGTGLLYSFVRTRARTVQAIAVAPAGPRRSYVLNVVAPGGTASVVREMAAMVRSFRLTPQGR